MAARQPVRFPSGVSGPECAEHGARGVCAEHELAHLATHLPGDDGFAPQPPGETRVGPSEGLAWRAVVCPLLLHWVRLVGFNGGEPRVAAVHLPAPGQGFGRVAQLQLEAGKLVRLRAAGPVLALQFAARGTCLEAAQILSDECPGQGGCVICAQNVEEHDRGQPCPRCGSWQRMTKGGDRLRGVDMQVLE